MLNIKYLEEFNINGEIINIEQIKDGNINKTYIVSYKINNKVLRILIQQINNYVFKNPYNVMDNIINVTNYINNQLYLNNDTQHLSLNVIKTKDNKNLLVIKNKDGIEEFYRAYNFIENAISYNSTKNLNIIENVGKAFGNFQKLLDKYPIENLHETISNFHNIKIRYEKFKEDIKLDEYNKVKEVKNEIEYILSKEKNVNIICDKLEKGEIPLRVTHNDTKVNNVMINKETLDYISVIDLDTVMPGSMLYDYGDGIRSAASNLVEDDQDFNKVFLRNDFFEAYTNGFLNEVKSIITEEELNLMPKSIFILTIELAMRFLDDYISGNKYFKCDYTEHNLVRARNQIYLAKDIEKKSDYITNYIFKVYKNN